MSMRIPIHYILNCVVIYVRHKMGTWLRQRRGDQGCFRDLTQGR
jgi:hypothetical protein